MCLSYNIWTIGMRIGLLSTVFGVGVRVSVPRCSCHQTPFVLHRLLKYTSCITLLKLPILQMCVNDDCDIIFLWPWAP